MTEVKALHDAMLLLKPEGAAHECPLCLEAPEGGKMEKSYTEDEMKSLVDQATEALRKELNEIKSSEAAKELDDKVAEARTEGESKVAEIQARLDEEVLKAANVAKELEDLKAEIEETRLTAEREAEVAARREDRVNRVSEVADFPEAYVEENAARWAAMEEEAFETLLVDYKAVSKKSESTDSGKGLPKETSMNAAREDSKNTAIAAYRELSALREQGVDPRQVIR